MIIFVAVRFDPGRKGYFFARAKLSWAAMPCQPLHGPGKQLSSLTLLGCCFVVAKPLRGQAPCVWARVMGS